MIKSLLWVLRRTILGILFFIQNYLHFSKPLNFYTIHQEVMYKFASKYHCLFLWSFYCPLYYFQELVDQHQMIYRFSNKRSAKFKLNNQINSSPLHIVVAKYFVLAYLFRCAGIIFVRQLTNTREKRILFGTEAAGPEYRYIEAASFFWSIIVVLFLQFTLSDDLQSYKWLAIFRMADVPSSKKRLKV